jgi:hypothetical protein
MDTRSQVCGRSQGKSNERVGKFVAKERDFISKASNLAHSLGTVDYFTGKRGTGPESDHFSSVYFRG